MVAWLYSIQAAERFLNSTAKFVVMLDRNKINLKPVTYSLYRELRVRMHKNDDRAYKSVDMLYAQIVPPMHEFGGFGELCARADADNLVFRLSIPLAHGWGRFYRPFSLTDVEVLAERNNVLFVHTSAGRDTHQLCFERDGTRIVPVDLFAPVAALPCYTWLGRAPRESYVHALVDAHQLNLRQR